MDNIPNKKAGQIYNDYGSPGDRHRLKHWLLNKNKMKLQNFLKEKGIRCQYRKKDSKLIIYKRYNAQLESIDKIMSFICEYYNLGGSTYIKKLVIK